MTITAYPLTWPKEFPRTKMREGGKFKATLAGALKNVQESLRLFASDSGKKLDGLIISSNVSLGAQRPEDPGVAVWFTWDGLGVCIAVDRYSTVEANLQAIHHIVEAQRAESGAGVSANFQTRVSSWMHDCFLPSLYSNMQERGDRMLEEVLELLQATGYDRTRVPTLVDYVFGRPAGEPSQEVGGVMVTLAAFCWIANLDMHAAGECELSRITRPEVMARIRAKQAAKNALRFDTPLPGQLAAAPEKGHG